MQRQESIARRTTTTPLAALICVGLWMSSSAVAHGGSNGGAGHGGSHSGGTGHGRGHHRGGGAGNGAAGGGWYQGGDHRGWVIPGYGYFFASLPSYCRPLYWEGALYFYADDVYFEWNSSVGAYEEVSPPAGLADEVGTQAPIATELFVFPAGGQTNEQVASDREACHGWAVQEVGFDPSALPTRTKDSDRSAAKRADYLHADKACLEARDYSVE